MYRVTAYAFTFLMSIAAPAHAAQSTPLAITELLTKTYIASARCRFLPSEGQRELAGYFHHAKRAATEIEGAWRAEEALERGRSSGEVAHCSSATRREVFSTLAAARRAMTASAGFERN
jgi:hypothetical protein